MKPYFRKQNKNSYLHNKFDFDPYLADKGVIKKMFNKLTRLFWKNKISKEATNGQANT